jgi:ABC-type sugar transport system substrate-binding protein
MLPKFKGENYFDAVKLGAQEAVDEINKAGKVVDFLYDGPPQDQATNQKQVDILEGWIAQKVSVIIVSPNDPNAIAPTLKKAQGRGIKVLTYDADAQEDARDLFVNQVVAEGVAIGLVKGAADNLRAKGYGPGKPANIGLVSSSKTDANQQSWLAEVKKLLATSEYNWLVIKNEDTDVYYPGPDETTTQTQSGTLIGRMGPGADQIQGAIGLTSMSVPALGSQYEAASVKPDPAKTVIVGLATPNAIKSYIKNAANPLDAGILWNCMDLGYLAIQAGYQMAQGTITGTSGSISAGRLGSKAIANRMVVLGPALVFDKNNVDQFNY